MLIPSLIGLNLIDFLSSGHAFESARMFWADAVFDAILIRFLWQARRGLAQMVQPSRIPVSG